MTMMTTAAVGDVFVDIGVGAVPPEQVAADAMSSSALAWGWSLQNVVLGVILFFCWCQGGQGGEGEGGDWRLRRCARRRRQGQWQSRGWGGAMTDCGDAHAGGGEDNGEANGEAGEIHRGLGGGLMRGRMSRGEILECAAVDPAVRMDGNGGRLTAGCKAGPQVLTRRRTPRGMRRVGGWR